MAAPADWFAPAVPRDHIDEPLNTQDTQQFRVGEVVDLNDAKQLQQLEAEFDADSSPLEKDEKKHDYGKDERDEKEPPLQSDKLTLLLNQVPPALRPMIRALDTDPAARESYLTNVYVDSKLDSSYDTETLAYFFWRQMLEMARTRGTPIHQQCINAVSRGQHAANGEGVRAFLAASPSLVVFSHIRASDDAFSAYAEAQERLKALREDPRRQVRQAIVRKSLELHVLSVLTVPQRDRLLKHRRYVCASYRSERAKGEAETLFTTGKPASRTSAFDTFADTYIQRTRMLAAHQAAESDPSLVRNARRRIKKTPWSGARHPRDIPTVPLSELVLTLSPNDEEAVHLAHPHHVLDTSPAIATFVADQVVYARELLEASAWKNASLMLGSLRYNETKEKSYVDWQLLKTVRVGDGDHVSITPNGLELWIVRAPTVDHPLVLERYMCHTGGKKVVLEHVPNDIILPGGVVPIGLEAGARQVVVHGAGGLFVIVPRAAAEAGGDARVDQAYGMWLPLASCFSLSGDECELWIGDEVGFVANVVLRDPDARKVRPLRWERTLWTGDIEPVMQVEARLSSVVALTRQGVSWWLMPENSDDALLRAPGFLLMPDALSVAHRGNHVAILDRLGAIRLVNMNSATTAHAAQSVDYDCDVLYKHMMKDGSPYISGAPGGASGASRQHLQWAGNSHALWAVYPSGAALAHVVFVSQFVDES